MALRVLLADESSTIKKVMQLALQDYSVEVKSVLTGLDVAQVTSQFLPDIIFADVLLTKKSGYDVCAELKQNPSFATIPVVLMWSGFMELDQKKVQQCKADGFLEKPFDANGLRQIVEKLVVKTQNNPIKDYLTFPKMPDFDEAAVTSEESLSLATRSFHIPTSTSAPTPLPASPKDFDIFKIPEIGEDEPLQIPGEDFQQVPLATQTPTSDSDSEDGDWMRQDLSQFKLKIPAKKPSHAEDFSKISVQKEELSQVRVETSSEFEEISFETPAKKLVAELNPASQQPTVSPLEGNWTQQDYERIIREEATKVIENLAWKILPDILERVAREELNKLLQDVDKSI